jgi:uncharacterized protein YbjT (DUF2867 family)
MEENATVLVVGATGAQGGSVARHLLGRGYPVRALTRDPDSAPAQALARAGAEVVRGDLGDRPSLRRALAGCWGAFGLVPGSANGAGTAAAAHGPNLIHAVAGSELEHFVFRLPPAADGEDGLEAYARSLDLPATYVRVTSPLPDDLGARVAAIFDRPGPYVGRTLTV